jgi:serine/threonine-protein kinase
VHRFGELSDGTPYLVMQFVRGRNLEDRLAAEGRLSSTQAKQILLEIASALAAAHAQSIVHRDVRPANVLWDDAEQKALLADFGIAALTTPTGADAVRLTRTGQMLGIPKYMSPEQLLDQEITAAADVYALGVLGYEILTGDGPYDATTNAQWITAHLQGTPKDLTALRPDIDPRIADLIRRCLNREPRRRPTASDLVRALQSGDQTTSDEGLTGDFQQLLKRRVPQIVLLAAGGGLGMMGLVDQLVDREVLPNVAYRVTLATAFCAVAVAGVVGWFHGERGRQRSPAIEWVLLALIAVLWVGLLGFAVATAR